MEREFLNLKPSYHEKVTSFNPTVWERVLREVQFDAFAPSEFAYILDGVTNGFSILAKATELQSNRRNLPATLCDKIAITQWIIKAVNTGWLLGPFSDAELQERSELRGVHISPVGCVLQPKPENPMNKRVITHMSAPRTGGALNSAISEESKYVQYVSLREICASLHIAGSAAYLWVADAADAYLHIKIKLRDRKYMGVKWCGKTLVYGCLCFGVASAPHIYSRFADSLEYTVLCRCGLRELVSSPLRPVRHYLDDFFGVGKTLESATRQYQTLLATWRELGVAWKPHKVSPPATKQRLLGFLFDVKRQLLLLPQEKIERYSGDIERLLRKRSATVKEIESIVGKLRWCATACFGAQPFIKQIENELIRVRRKGLAFMNLSADIKGTLRLCVIILNQLGIGVPFAYYVKEVSDSDIHVWTDASSTRGCGGCSSIGLAFSLRWNDIWSDAREVEVNLAELIAVAIMVIECARAFAGKAITFHIDNKSVHSWLKRKSSRLRHAQFLLRTICAIAFQHNFVFWSDWIPREMNCEADALSKGLTNWPITPRHSQRFSGDSAISLLNSHQCMSAIRSLLTVGPPSVGQGSAGTSDARAVSRSL